MLTKQSKLLLFLIIAVLIVGFFLYRDISVIQKYIPHMIIISIIYGIGIYLYSHYEKLESVENAVIVGAIHAIGMLTFLFMLRASYERRMA